MAFNPYKHHLGFLRTKIADWKKMNWEDVAMELKLLGNNLIDLYYGKLSIGEIFSEIQQFALKNKIESPETLDQWLYPLEYRKTRLSDQSYWVIKQGKDSSHFLHIHPGKYSPFTVRVKAPALKTVIALNIFDNADSYPGLSLVNRIRREKLGLSPVKGLVEGKGIARLYANFNRM